MRGSNEQRAIRLSMMLDGELGLEERRELEATLQNDLQARSMHETLREGGRHGREVFAELLKEPVPLDLVRSIKTASSPRKAVRLPGDQVGLFSGKPTVSQAALAILLAVALGGGIGYMLGQQPSITRQAVTTDDVDWLSDVVTHYRIFSRQPENLVEMPASDPAAIVEWLLGSTGINFRIPDLSENDLRFEGARLFAAGGLPVGELLYRSAEGEVISILFRKNQPEDDGFSELIRDNIALISWKSPTTTYLVVGPSSAASLDEIAAKAAGLI